MSKYIIGASIITVGVIFYFGFASNEGTSVDSSRIVSAITVDRTSHDFGDIDIFGGKVSTTYTLKNTGEQSVRITSAVTSCMCTEGEIEGMRFGMHNNSSQAVIIPAGKESVLTAIFDPLAHGPDGTGRVTRQLMLETDSSITPKIQVRFSANVTKE